MPPNLPSWAGAGVSSKPLTPTRTRKCREPVTDVIRVQPAPVNAPQPQPQTPSTRQKQEDEAGFKLKPAQDTVPVKIGPR